MSEQKKQTHFSPLNDIETIGRYRFAVKENAVVKCWSKGESTRFSFQITYFFETHFSFELKDLGPVPPNFTGEVLMTFDVTGVQYFCGGKIQADSKPGHHVITLPKTIFKCERRKNFRLKVYPQKSVRCYFNIKAMKRFRGGDVISLKASEELADTMAEDFSNLLKSESGMATNKYVMCLRADDISANGIALLVGVMEADYFEKDAIVEKFGLVFEKKTYEIPKAKVSYVMDYKDPKKVGVKAFKVGLQFLEMTESLDYELSAQIAKEIRGVDAGKEFEEFIK